MSIKDSYNKRVTFDKQDGLEDKIDTLTVMMGKLVAKIRGLIGNSNLRFLRADEGYGVDIFVIHTIIKIDTDQIA